MDPTTETPKRAAAERSLASAVKLLAARDLAGSKHFASLALDSDLLSDDRPDQIIAVADVLLASDNISGDNPHHLDCYSVLQLPKATPNLSPDLLKKHYRRLSLLLHPDRNRLPFADRAFRIVADAYETLSDPFKKSALDAALKIFDPNLAFWTLCPSCCHAHQYDRAHLNKTLRCQNCRNPFFSAELNSPPNIVPGTDLYYATWGVFPLGFASPSGSDWTPFQNAAKTPNNAVGGDVTSTTHTNANANANANANTYTMGGTRIKKAVAKRKMMASKSRMMSEGPEEEEDGGITREKEEGIMREEEEGRGININEAAKGAGEDDIEMMIDFDATNAMFGNLHNLPFMN